MRTRAELRSLFPRFRGIEGISVFRFDDYHVAAQNARLTPDERELFLELAIERHSKAIERQKAANLRYYGTTANRGRNRFLQNRVRQGNVAAIDSLRARRLEYVR